MSASPQDTVLTIANTPVNATTTANASTNLQLSTLLTETYTENEALKKELNDTRRRADKAERLLQALSEASSSSSPSSESSTKRVILEYEERVQRAEIAREDAETRRRAVSENWTVLDRWLQMAEFRTLEAREGFGRIVKEGAGQLTLTPLMALGTPSMALSTPSMAPPPPPPSSQRRHATRTPMTPFPSLPLPPLPPTTSSTSRRPRTPSLESEYIHPPSKRSRGNGEPRLSFSDSHIHLEQHGYPPPTTTTASAPRIIMSPGHHHKPHPHPHPSHSHLHPHQHHPHHGHSRRPHSRSSSRSSSASLDVDEMLLRATTADEINGIAANQPPPMASLPLPTTTTSQNGSPHLRHHSRRHGEEGAGSRRVHVYQGQQAQEGAGYAYPANQSVPRKELSSGVGLQQQPGGGGQQPGPLVQPGQVQQYQTHVFAPVVTGAPMKKPKYSVSGSSIGGGGSVGALAGAGGGGPAGAGGPIDAPIAAPPAQVFPATNAQGQRICRQCGLPGRYKDNKCVEKWGPGPMGPGTVCDRCRKKMKRVERRGTLESQQQMAVMHQHQQQQQQQQQQPSRGGSMSQLPLSQGSDRSIHRTDTVLTHHGGVGSFSQPSQSQSQTLREQSQSQPHTQTQAPPRSLHSHPSHTSHLRTPTVTQAGGVSPNRSPPPSIAAFEEDEGEEEDAEHEREQEHDGEDGDSEQLPLSNVGRGGRVGSKSRAGVKNNGATRGKGGAGGGGRRSTPASGGGRSTPAVGGRSTPAGRGTPSGAKTTPANKKSPLGTAISPTHGMEVDETDADAEADAEAEAEAEILGAVEATGGGDQEMVDPDGDGDAEAELLEAVDAAEANSSSSSSHGGAGGGGWMKEEEDGA